MYPVPNTGYGMSSTNNSIAIPSTTDGTSSQTQPNKLADWLDTTSLSRDTDRRNFVGFVESPSTRLPVSIQLDVYSRVTGLVPTIIRKDHPVPYPWVS